MSAYQTMIVRFKAVNLHLHDPNSKSFEFSSTSVKALELYYKIEKMCFDNLAWCFRLIAEA